MTHLPIVRLSLPMLLLAVILGGVTAQPRAGFAQQEPVAVVAVSGVDRFLEGVDYLFAAGEAPQHAQVVRGVLSSLNELRGLDRARPVGVYFYFPAGGEQEPQPLLFFPVADVEELLTSIRIGTALRLERAEEDNRLTLHTDDGAFPIVVQGGYGFLDPSKSGARLSQPLSDPAALLQDALTEHDAVLVIRREGIPPFLLEVALGQIRTEALKGQRRKSGESEAEHALRRGVEEPVFSLMEALVQEWAGTTVGLRFSSIERTVQVDVNLLLRPDGRTIRFFDETRGGGTQFAAQASSLSAFSLAIAGQPTAGGRDLLGRVLTMLRSQLEEEVRDADEESQAAVRGVLDALDATAASGQADASVQLVGGPPEGYVLIGAAAIRDGGKLAAGLERLLPHAVESREIRSIDMAVARAGAVAIHRIWPASLRTQDRRLYGEDAAIYLAAGDRALWLAVGSEGTAERLADAIAASQSAESTTSAEEGDRSESPVRDRASAGLLEVTVHASDWVGLAPTNAGGRRDKLAQFARQAFENPDEDTFRLHLHPRETGLELSLYLDHGYVRLLGLALAARLAGAE